MIEVYYIKKKGLGLKGYLNEQKQVLNKNKKMRAYVKGNKIFFWTNELVYTLTDNAIIRPDGEIEGYLSNAKISNYDNSPYIRLNLQTGEVEVVVDLAPLKYKPFFLLKGDLNQVDDLIFLAFCFWFLDFGR
jgi:hypothetical protein